MSKGMQREILAGLLSMDGLQEVDGTAVMYCEVQRGLLLYHIRRLREGRYRLYNAGDYLIADHSFETFDDVLKYINNGEELR